MAELIPIVLRDTVAMLAILAAIGVAAVLFVLALRLPFTILDRLAERGLRRAADRARGGRKSPGSSPPDESNRGANVAGGGRDRRS